LRNLTADLPAGQIPGQAEHDAGPRTAPARPGPAPRPFASLWVMAVIWLAIAAAAHAAAAAIPLVLLSLFVLRAARWTMPPEQPPQCPVHQSGEHAAHTQPPWATQDLGQRLSRRS
jgi:outer membrane biosynthesis protein TonB